MSVLSIHIITLGLIAISFALSYQVRKQTIDTMNNMQREIDELKSKLLSSAGGSAPPSSSS
jgi:hypothetical protein